MDDHHPVKPATRSGPAAGRGPQPADREAIDRQRLFIDNRGNPSFTAHSGQCPRPHGV